jgi:ATP-dependent DNA ligase
MRYIYPPKPILISIDQPLFKELDADPDVVGELKYNGTRLELYVYEPIRPTVQRFEFWGREKQRLTYSPSEKVIECLNQIQWEGNCLVDGELLHFKSKQTKNMIVIWDVFVWNDEFLGKQTFAERRKLLESAMPVSFQTGEFKDVFLSRQWSTGFKAVYDEYTKIAWIEGLVMKKLSAKLIVGTTSCPDVPYMWKVRKANKNYRF